MVRWNHQPNEVGAGWVDPQRLGNLLRSPVRLLCYPVAQRGSWLSATALTLVVLSWWHNVSVHEVVSRLIHSIGVLLN